MKIYIYAIFLITNKFYVQLLSNTKEFVCLHNRQKWAGFIDYNLSILFALVGEDVRQSFGRSQHGSRSLIFVAP